VDSGSIKFTETSDSDIDYTQEENWNATHAAVEDKVMNDDTVAQNNDIQFSKVCRTHRQHKIPLT
jgi:hypothetical protein